MGKRLELVGFPQVFHSLDRGEWLVAMKKGKSMNQDSKNGRRRIVFKIA
jgi:hypothetical protein